MFNNPNLIDVCVICWNNVESNKPYAIVPYLAESNLLYHPKCLLKYIKKNGPKSPNTQNEIGTIEIHRNHQRLLVKTLDDAKQKKRKTESEIQSSSFWKPDYKSFFSNNNKNITGSVFPKTN